VPGQATGDLYISGNVARTSWGDTQGGYFTPIPHPNSFPGNSGYKVT